MPKASQPPAYAVVFITAKDAEEAEKISKTLVISTPNKVI